MRNNRNRYLVGLLIIIAIVFFFSNQPMETSQMLSEFVARLLGIGRDGLQLDRSAQPLMFGLSLRKIAHVFLYFVMGIFMFLWLKGYGWRGRRVVLVSVAFCYILACIDEVHQLFISGRSAKITDTFVDAIGFFAGILLMLLVTRWHAQKQIHKE